MRPMHLRTALFALPFCLGALASPSLAKTMPLNVPAGLAVDTAGNLYVANNGGNNILIYNKGYTQQTAQTITNGIAAPVGVALDPYGNLWVSNFDASNGGTNGSIAEYKAGVLQPGNAITNGILGPKSIFFDGLANLWVVNNGGYQSSITIYSPTSAGAPPSNLVRTINSPIDTIQALGEAAGLLVTGTSSLTCFASASAIFQGGTSFCDYYSNFGVTAVASDSSGQSYAASQDAQNDVLVDYPDGIHFFILTSLPFASAGGLAVDNVNYRLYVANTSGNQIVVYSIKAGTTYGHLLKTIHN